MSKRKTTSVLFGTILFSIFAFANLLNGVCVAQIAAPQIETFDGKSIASLDAWNVISGNWQVQGDSLVVDSFDADAYITFGDPAWQNYEVEASVSLLQARDPSRWLSVLVRATRNGDKPWSQVAMRSDTTKPNGVEFSVRTPANGWSVRGKASAPAACNRNTRHLKVVVRGSRIEGFLDGQLVISSQLCVDRPNGCVGLGASGCVAAFDDVSVRHLPASTDPPVAPTIQCDIVAHRGFSAIAPENTLAAIRQGTD
ncbi:hypothetical protein ACFL2H_04770, partial [Planctomycetota bacterium]